MLGWIANNSPSVHSKTTTSGLTSMPNWGMLSNKPLSNSLQFSPVSVSNLTCCNNCYYHCKCFTAFWILSATTQGSQYQKCKTKTNLDFLEQETVSGSGISWAICKSAPRPRQITMPAPTTHFCRLDALPAAQPTASKHCWNKLTKFICTILAYMWENRQ